MFVLNSTVAFVSLLYFKAEIGNHKVTSVIIHACTRQASSDSSPTKILGPGWLWPSRRGPMRSPAAGWKAHQAQPQLAKNSQHQNHPVGFATFSGR